MRFIQKLRLILTIQCDQVSRLESESFERKLPWHEAWALRLHRLVCKSCRQFLRHLRIMHESFQRLSRVDENVAEPQPLELSPSAKERIRQRIAEEK